MREWCIFLEKILQDDESIYCTLNKASSLSTLDISVITPSSAHIEPLEIIYLSRPSAWSPLSKTKPGSLPLREQFKSHHFPSHMPPSYFIPGCLTAYKLFIQLAVLFLGEKSDAKEVKWRVLHIITSSLTHFVWTVTIVFHHNIIRWVLSLPVLKMRGLNFRS